MDFDSVEEYVGYDTVEMAKNEDVSTEELAALIITALGAYSLRTRIYPSTVLLSLGDVNELWPAEAVDKKRNRQLVADLTAKL